MSTARIGLIDYGAGNFASVRNALDHLQLNFFEIRSPAQLQRATHLIVPGVGAFASAMRRLEEMKVIDELRDQVLI
jgi:glutamine amidotransferase